MEKSDKNVGVDLHRPWELIGRPWELIGGRRNAIQKTVHPDMSALDLMRKGKASVAYDPLRRRLVAVL